MFVLGQTADTVRRFTLSTAWDVSTAVNDGVSKEMDITAVIGPSTWNSMFFKDDGTKIYLLDGNTIYQSSLSTAWDVSTATYDSVSYEVFQDLQDGAPNGLAFKIQSSNTKTGAPKSWPLVIDIVGLLLEMKYLRDMC